MGKTKKEKPRLTPEQVIRQRRTRILIRRDGWALVWKIALFALSIWLVFTFLFGVGIVQGEGMYPRLRDGDVVAYYRLQKTFDIGDIVTFSQNGSRRYGRIVAVGGDTVDMTEDGSLVINGNVQQEEVFFPTYKNGRETSFPVTLGKDELFLLGDDRVEAYDSRDYGAVSTEDVDGTIITLLLRRRGL